MSTDLHDKETGITKAIAKTINFGELHGHVDMARYFLPDVNAGFSIAYDNATCTAILHEILEHIRIARIKGGRVSFVVLSYDLFDRILIGSPDSIELDKPNIPMIRGVDVLVSQRPNIVKVV